MKIYSEKKVFIFTLIILRVANQRYLLEFKRDVIFWNAMNAVILRTIHFIFICLDKGEFLGTFEKYHIAAIFKGYYSILIFYRFYCTGFAQKIDLYFIFKDWDIHALNKRIAISGKLIEQTFMVSSCPKFQIINGFIIKKYIKNSDYYIQMVTKVVDKAK